ncbi:MAG: adenylate/guanylate cyclase domain-containing protein [Pseudomonadota bacterium]
MKARISQVRTLGLAIALVLLAGHIAFSAQLQPLRERTFDVYQQLSARPSPPSPVIIVRIDDDSLRAHGRWPWNRTVLADLVDAIGRNGAAIIGIDLLMPERDSSTDGPAADSRLADAIGQYGAALAVSLGNVATSHEATPKAGWSLVGDVPEALPGFPGLVASLPELNQQAAGLGVIRAVPDSDGVLRRVPLVWLRNLPPGRERPNEIWPGFALELVRLGIGVPDFAVRMGSGGFDALKIGDAVIRLDPTGAIRLWESDSPSRTVSAAALLSGQVDTRLRGSIAIISLDAVGLAQYQVTPTQPARLGSDIHRILIEQMLTGSFLSEPQNARTVERIWFAVSALAIVVLSGVLARQFLLGALINGVLILAPLASGYAAYLYRQELFDPLQPAIGIFLVAAAEGYSQFRQSEKRRSELRRQFAQYMSPAVVSYLLEAGDDVLETGQRREITILMTDIRGFTALSETLETQRLIRLVNHFLGLATQEILSRDGTIDKFMGDAVLAFWNAPIDQPDHRKKALEAAQALISRVAETNAELESEGYAPLRIGVALESGECSIGNFGSEQRFDYTAVGPPVNRAARLESVTKELGVPLVLGPGFASDAPIDLVEAGKFALQGIAGKTPVYTTPSYRRDTPATAAPKRKSPRTRAPKSKPQ